ncbi:precorrin-8X methylmutase [Candidatus Hodgkinia cicadicola]
MFRTAKQIKALSHNIALERLVLTSCKVDSALVALKLFHCFGFDVFKYCVYTDGVFGELKRALVEGCLVATDTSALSCLLACSGLSPRVGVCCIAKSYKACGLAHRLCCTKSCVQIDLWANVMVRSLCKSLVVVIATCPTSLLRLLELAKARVIMPKAVVACPVGAVSASVSKQMLAFSRLGIPFLAIRSKLGGIAFGAAVLNALC